jgi:putative phage-type endonuclease
MLGADRLIANKALDQEGWLSARERKITATLIAQASTPKGYEDALIKLRGQAPEVVDNSYMEFGRRMEGYISMWVKDKYGVIPNEWLLRHETIPEFVATPDGVTWDSPTIISEVKTTGTDWGEWRKVPIAYRRQVQWQMFVAGAEQCVFAWLLREEQGGRFMSPWLEPKGIIVDRDEEEIGKLSVVADKLLKEMKEESNATV